MANLRTSGANFTQASVDTDPGALGFGTSAVSVNVSENKLLFYIKQIATDGEVTLQWQQKGDLAWYDEGDAYTATGKYVIQDKNEDVFYQAIVKDGKHGSAQPSIFGIQW